MRKREELIKKINRTQISTYNLFTAIYDYRIDTIIVYSTKSGKVAYIDNDFKIKSKFNNLDGEIELLEKILKDIK